MKSIIFAVLGANHKRIQIFLGLFVLFMISPPLSCNALNSKASWYFPTHFGLPDDGCNPPFVCTAVSYSACVEAEDDFAYAQPVATLMGQNYNLSEESDTTRRGVPLWSTSLPLQVGINLIAGDDGLNNPYGQLAVQLNQGPTYLITLGSTQCTKPQGCGINVNHYYQGYDIGAAYSWDEILTYYIKEVQVGDPWDKGYKPQGTVTTGAFKIPDDHYAYCPGEQNIDKKTGSVQTPAALKVSQKTILQEVNNGNTTYPPSATQDPAEIMTYTWKYKPGDTVIAITTITVADGGHAVVSLGPFPKKCEKAN